MVFVAAFVLNKDLSYNQFGLKKYAQRLGVVYPLLFLRR